MYSFILQILMMASLGTMIYLLARAVPRIGDEITGPENNKFDKLISSLPLEKIDAVFEKFLEKTLRKFRLVLLKFDNTLGGYLNKVRKLNGNGHKNGDSKLGLFNGNGNKEGEKDGNQE